MNEFNLEDLLTVACCQYHEDLCKNVYNYITNLQQELENYKDLDNSNMETIDCQELEIVNKENIINELQQENERLNKEVAKLHIIQEEYGNHIENTHIIDDYQKTYFMSNKWLIELKNGKFVYIDDLNDKYEDYKSKVDNALKIIEKEKELMEYAKYDSCLLLIENTLKNGSEENNTNNVDDVYKAFGLKD